jgi:hypothetical protein
MALYDDPQSPDAVASRILLAVDDATLCRLLGRPDLSTHAPELRPVLAHLHRHTPDREVFGRLDGMLAVFPEPELAPDPAVGLGPDQRTRLGREALRWAVVALDPLAADPAELGALDILRGCLDRPRARVPESTAPGVVGDCLRAAASGDLRAALDAGVAAVVEAARRDPARDGSDTVVDLDRVTGLARLAQLFTARQIRAGLEPLPPGRLSPLLLNGPDALAVGVAARQRPVALALHRPRPHPADHEPASAARLIRCTDCDARLRLWGEVAWVYRDDDRFAASEDGYAGDLTGTCAACAADRRVEVRLDLTISRGDGSAELTWHAEWERRAPA